MTRRISLSLLTIAAMLSTSCEHTPKGQVQRCVDANSRVVGDGECDLPQHVGPGYGPYPFYRWYYGGTGYAPGEIAAGGGFEPAPDLPVFRSTSPEGMAIIRGGFGSSFVGGS